MASQRERARAQLKRLIEEDSWPCKTDEIAEVMCDFATSELAARDAAIGELVKAAERVDNLACQWSDSDVNRSAMSDLKTSLAAYKKTEVQP